MAWGHNGFGQTTVPAEAQTGITAISAGNVHSLALTGDGRVIAWGNNEHGQAAVPAEAQSGIKSIAGGGWHSLALTDDGRVIAWGWNDRGQASVPVEAQHGVIAISAGGWHSLALTADGRVIAWGWNHDGQVSVPVEAGAGITAISAGAGHSLALTADGRVIAWGSNYRGQISIPAEAWAGITAISAGDTHSLALATGGRTIAWGSNSSGQSTIPANARNGITAISAGSHSMALGQIPGRVSVVEGDGAAKVEWDRYAQGPLSGYRIDSAPAGTQEWTTREVTSASATSVDLTALPNDQPLQFRVVAVHAGTALGTSLTSDAVVLGKPDTLRTVSGSIRNADGTPVPGVTWSSTDAAGSFTDAGSTRADGSFAFLARRTTSTTLKLSGRVVGTVRLGSGTPRIDVTLAEEPRKFQRSIVVTDKDGYAVRNATVTPTQHPWHRGLLTASHPELHVPGLYYSGQVPGFGEATTGSDGLAQLKTWVDYSAGAFAEVTSAIKPGATQRTTVHTSDLAGTDPYNQVAVAVLPYAPIMTEAPEGAANQSTPWSRSATGKSVQVRATTGDPLPDVTVSLVPRLAGDTPEVPREGPAVATATTGPDGIATFPATLPAGKYRAVPRNISARTVDLAIAAVVPGAPSGVTGTTGDSRASVSWKAPAVTGGSPITGYTATATPGGKSCTTTGTGCTITGLTNGTAYSITVRATNAAGAGPNSAATTVTPKTVPGTPRAVTARPGNGSATVSWTAPASNGGATITRYTASASGRSCTTTGTSCTITGLANGITHKVTVRATNIAGAGGPSAVALATPRIPVTAKVAAKPGRTLYVDVNPDRGASSHAFRVQKRNSNGTWTTLTTRYTTTGSTETSSIRLAAGTYRVWVPTYRAYGEAYSAAVRVR